MNWGWTVLVFAFGVSVGWVAMGLLVRADRKKTWEDLIEGRYQIHEAYRDKKVPRYEDAEEVLLCARRYRSVRRGQHWSVINGIGDELRADALDAAIDAAIAQEGKG
jgi:hypothetical protein